MRNHIYLLREQLIGSRVFTAGEIADAETSDRVKYLAYRGVGIPLTDALSHQGNQNFLRAVIHHCLQLNTSDSIAFAKEVKKLLPKSDEKPVETKAKKVSAKKTKEIK